MAAAAARTRLELLPSLLKLMLPWSEDPSPLPAPLRLLLLLVLALVLRLLLLWLLPPALGRIDLRTERARVMTAVGCSWAWAWPWA